LTDNDNSQSTSKQVRQEDIQNQLAGLLNSLNKEENLIMRLYHRIIPRTLIDIYYLADEEEKKTLEIEFKKKAKTFHSLDLVEKKCQKSVLVKKYLTLFGTKYTIAKLAALINRPESSVSKLRNNALEQLKTKIKEKDMKKLYDLFC
jgi:DNA-directed RNA polymerase sigma subunit (sigma70/sigma32)